MINMLFFPLILTNVFFFSDQFLSCSVHLTTKTGFYNNTKLDALPKNWKQEQSGFQHKPISSKCGINLSRCNHLIASPYFVTFNKLFQQEQSTKNKQIYKNLHTV